MADNPTTTVSYDVSAAINSLESLDSKVKQSGDVADSAFNKGAASSRTFESGVNSLANTMGSGAASTTFYANQTLELAGNITKAAEVASNFIQIIAEQGFGYETAAHQVEEYIARLDSIGRTIQGAADIQNAADNAAIERQLFLSSRSQQATERLQVQENAAKQQSLSNQLSASKSYYSQLDSLADKSAQTRKQVEDKLADLVASTNERRFIQSISRLSNNQQVAKLIEQANQLKDQGGEKNLESAQNLLNTALQRAQAGGNNFNQRRVEDAFTGLIQKRAEDAKAADNQANKTRATADAQAAATKAIDDQSRALRDQSAEINKQIQQNAIVRQNAKQQQEDNRANQAFQAAQKQFRTQLLELQENADKQINPVDRLPSFSGAIKEAGISETEFNHQKAIVEEAFALRDKIDAKIKADPTPRGVASTSGDQERLKALLGEVQDIPNLSKALVPDNKELQTSVELYDKILKSARDTAAASRSITGAAPESVSPIRPNGSAPSNPAAQPGPSQSTVNQNVNVDVAIKGGMIDADTAQQIADIVKREIRKGNATA